MKNLKRYNSVELDILQNVRNQIKWHLGVELGYDPDSAPTGFIEVEMRLRNMAHFWEVEESGWQVNQK